MVMQAYATVSSPPVILEEGNYSGTTTIYTNKTSAKVNVAAPLFDYVDNNGSNVDESADKGTHSNFTAQQAGPDSINDTLTEENTGETGVGTEYPIQNMNFTSDTSSWDFILISGTDFAGGWDNTGQSGGSAYIDVTTRNEAGEAYWNQSFTATVNSSLQSVDLNHRWKVEVWNVVDSGALKVILVHPNGTSWDVWTQTLSGTTAWSSLVYTNITSYVDANGTYSLRLDLVADLGNDNAAQLKIYYDDSGVALVYGAEPNYELDLEVQWTSVDYDETNEELCIYGGTMGSENITVDVWNGSAWKNLFTDLSSGWNNVSVSSYLTSSNFTIRFKGGNETGDATQDSWNIDATLLHLWTGNSTYDYVLQVVNQVEDNWTINLQVYDSSNITRLSKTTISFHDGNSSDQIIVSNGGISQSEGPPYNLAGNATIYISMSNVQASSSGTSYLYVYLKILVPDKSTYSLYVITFEIT